MGTTEKIIIIIIKEEKPAALLLKGTSIYQHLESRVLNGLLNSNQIIQSFLTQLHPSDNGTLSNFSGLPKEKNQDHLGLRL